MKAMNRLIYRHITSQIAVMAIALTMALTCTSCFGDEPDGCEADIETVTLHVASPGEFFFQTTDSMQTVYSTDSIITFSVRSHADVSALAPSSPCHQVQRCRPPVARHMTSATGR